jgi:hypothetical protein
MTRDSDVEAHGIKLNNTNEAAVDEDETEAHGVSLNTNETALDDDEVEAHSSYNNTNESVESDD